MNDDYETETSQCGLVTKRYGGGMCVRVRRPLEPCVFPPAQPELSDEIIEMLLERILLSHNYVKELNLLAAVNRRWYRIVVGNWGLWKKVFTRLRFLGLPNHKHRSILPWLLDNHIRTFDDVPRVRRQYRRMVTLHMTSRCSLCGRNQWCQGLRFYDLNVVACNFCTLDNLVSHRMLYDRYGITVYGRVGETRFASLVSRGVHYFLIHVTSFQRMRYSVEPLDLREGKSNLFFFWLPDLAKVINLKALEAQRPARYAAAQIIKAMVRRQVVRRLCNSFSDLTKGVLWVALKDREILARTAKFPDYLRRKHPAQKYARQLVANQEYQAPMRDVVPICSLQYLSLFV